jgi:hypothetical protein
MGLSLHGSAAQKRREYLIERMEQSLFQNKAENPKTKRGSARDQV